MEFLDFLVERISVGESVVIMAVCLCTMLLLTRMHTLFVNQWGNQMITHNYLKALHDHFGVDFEEWLKKQDEKDI